MPTLKRDLLVREHATLLALADGLTASLNGSPSVPDITATRWRMTRVLTLHLAREDRLLYPKLQASHNSQIASIAERIAREMGGLSNAWRDYMTDWPAGRLENDWIDFRTATSAILAKLRTRIAAEERELYPHVERREGGFCKLELDHRCYGNSGDDSSCAPVSSVTAIA